LVVLAVVIVLIAGLLWPVHLRLRAAGSGSGILARVTLRFFFTLIPIRLVWALHWQGTGGLSLVRVTRSGRCAPLKKPGRETKLPTLDAALLRAIKRSIGLRKFHLRCTIGSTQDAAMTALLCGGAQSTLETLLLLLFAPKDPACVAVQVGPDFDADWFRLELESILLLWSANIIIAVIKRHFSLRGAKANDPSHREHHEEFYGAH